MPERGTNNVYPVILVGGKGKRLRPLSSESRPKAFLSVTRDKKTMFRRAVERTKKIAPAGRIVVVANRKHSGLVRMDLRGAGRTILLLEPISRNTAPAIAYAAFRLRKIREDAVMVILPADQYILDEKRYIRSVRQGIEFVKNNDDAIVVLGDKPDRPATEYGYVKLTANSSQLTGKRIYKVERFVEKPDLKTANRYLKDGRYLWNTGAFIFKAGTIVNILREFAPEIYRRFKRPGRVDYKRLPDISIDYAVMEDAPNIYCVKGSYRWQDMGNIASLKKILKREKRKFILKKGKIAGIA